MDCQYSFVIMQQIICTFCGQRNENAFFSLAMVWVPARVGRGGNQNARVGLAIVTKDQAHEL